MGRVVSPTPTPLSSGRVVPALVASYDMHGRAVGLFYTQPTGQRSRIGSLLALLAYEYPGEYGLTGKAFVCSDYGWNQLQTFLHSRPVW